MLPWRHHKLTSRLCAKTEYWWWRKSSINVSKLTNFVLTSVNVLLVNCRINAVFPILLSPTTTTDTFRLFSILISQKLREIKQLLSVLNCNLTEPHILVMKLHIIELSSWCVIHMNIISNHCLQKWWPQKLKPLLPIDN